MLIACKLLTKLITGSSHKTRFMNSRISSTIIIGLFYLLACKGKADTAEEPAAGTVMERDRCAEKTGRRAELGRLPGVAEVLLRN